VAKVSLPGNSADSNYWWYRGFIGSLLSRDSPTLIDLYLNNPYPHEIRNQPIRIGVPFARADLFAPESLELSTAQGQALSHFAHVLSYWEDGSLRWVLLEFIASVAADASQTLTLTCQSDESVPVAAEQTPPLQSARSDERQTRTRVEPFQFEARSIRYEFDALAQEVFPVVRSGVDDDLLMESIVLTLTDAQGQTQAMSPLTRSLIRGDEQQMSVVVVSGKFEWPEQAVCLPVNVEMSLYSDIPIVDIQIVVHNPQAARHPGGIWDLGDPSSVLIDSLTLSLDLPSGAQMAWRSSDEQPWQQTSAETLSIEQLSSGGEQWNCRTHVDAKGEVSLARRGFVVLENEQKLASGLRAEPAFRVNRDGKFASLHPQHFWQKFPTAIRKDGAGLHLDLLPAVIGEQYELQGGESLTRATYLSFAEDPDSHRWMNHALQVSVASEAVLRSGVVNDWHGLEIDERYRALIRSSIEGDQSFKASYRITTINTMPFTASFAST